MKVEEVLRGVERLALDTSPLIYYIEDSPLYAKPIAPIFEQIDSGRIGGVTSVLTLTEVLVQPLLRGDASLCDRYRKLILESRHLEVLQISVEIADRAAHLRAAYGLRIPDAMQLATALHANCEAFLTNDSRFKRVAEIRILLLSEIVG